MGKNIIAARKTVDKTRAYPLEEAISAIKAACFAKFDETMEMAVSLGVDPRHSDQAVRGMVSLPAGTGKEIRIAVICGEEKAAEARTAGADLIGSADIIEDIKAGKIDFDICIATPNMMGLIGQVARVLGPKGLMPNPKLGTVTLNVGKAVEDARKGQVEYRVEKKGIVHARIGKASFAVSDLYKNAQALIESIIKAKPPGARGTYLKGIYLSSTMGPSVKVDLSTVSQ